MDHSSSSDFSSSIRITRIMESDVRNSMTTSTNQGSDFEQSLHESEVQDSEELVEMYCEDCHSEGKDETATGYCIDCVKYFCQNCLKFHKKYISGHKQLENSDMPKDVCLEQCDIHDDELIKFYCHRCDKFACKLCKDISHKSCNSLNHVPELVKDIENGQELKDVVQDLEKMDSKLRGIHDDIDRNEQVIEQIRDDTDLAIENNADNISEMIKEKINILKLQVEEKAQNDRKRLKVISVLYENLKSETETLKNQIKYQNDAKQRCKLFMTLKRARRNLKDFERKLQEMNKKNVVEEYRFEPGTKMSTLDEKDFGKIVGKGEKEQDLQKRVAQEINVKAENELLDCAIWNICLYPENFLIVCDGRNCSIKSIDLRTNKIISVMPINNPICVSKVSNNKLVVACINVSELSFMSLSLSGTINNLHQKIETEMPCWDVVCNDNHFIVTMFQTRSSSPGKIQELDKDGVVLRSIQCNFMGKMFRISKMTLSLDGRSLFMVDLMKDAVIKMTVDGKLVATYENENLTQVYGLTASREGSVYVCDSGSYQIHKLSADCSQSEVQFNKSHGLWRPICITCSANYDKLYVGEAHQNTIKVLNI